MNIPSKASWCIRKILQIRPLALRFIHYKVGMDSSFLFWHDPWVQGTTILSRMQHHIISLAESTCFARTGQYTSNSTWQLPSSNHPAVAELRRLVLPVHIHRHDSISWREIPTHLINVNAIWNCMRNAITPPVWISAIWHPLAIPKCSFNLWLALKGRLLTKDRMRRFHMQTDLACVLCNSTMECHQHIFATCPSISEILQHPSLLFTGNWSDYSLGHIIIGRTVGIRKLLGNLYIAGFFYMVWWERNSSTHNANHRIQAASLRGLVKRMIREKLHSNKRFQQAVAKDFNLVLDLY
nr:PREDICTED: uncharacterized protein LOC108204070 [Daucus carota subsp. sativus]